MINSRKLKETLQDAKSDIHTNIGNMHVIANDAERVSSIAKNAHIIISNIDRQFEQATKLTGIDIGFLFFATALQVVRQYFITNFKERTAHNVADRDAKKIGQKILGKKTKTERTERMNSTHAWYRPSQQEVTFNPVPFDQTTGIKGLGGGFEHRAKTPGHDAILGYIFGTVNIATSTLTKWDGILTNASFHVKYGQCGTQLRPMITNNAQTNLVFQKTIERFLEDGIEGKLIVAISLIREALHLKSDIDSKVSLPIPIISAISPDFAKEIAKYGFDMANIKVVGTQALYAGLINSIIAMLHRLIHENNGGGSLTLYEVRTRKIVSYSNLIASVSNIIAVAIGTAIGSISGNGEMVKKSLSYLNALENKNKKQENTTLTKIAQYVTALHFIRLSSLLGSSDWQ